MTKLFPLGVRTQVEEALNFLDELMTVNSAIVVIFEGSASEDEFESRMNAAKMRRFLRRSSEKYLCTNMKSGGCIFTQKYAKCVKSPPLRRLITDVNADKK